jgi:hypothetical protein
MNANHEFYPDNRNFPLARLTKAENKGGNLQLPGGGGGGGATVLTPGIRTVSTCWPVTLSVR